MRTGACYEPTNSERHIYVSGCSFLPTPTKSMGKRGWGISKTGRHRYSQEIVRYALMLGYKPPVWLLEWMMGFPPNYTSLASAPSATPSSRKSRNGSGDA